MTDLSTEEQTIPESPDWLQLVQDVNLGTIVMPWMLGNAVPNYFSYLLAVINSPHRQDWMLYAALNLVFTPQVPYEVLKELKALLVKNRFDPAQVYSLANIQASPLPTVNVSSSLKL